MTPHDVVDSIHGDFAVLNIGQITGTFGGTGKSRRTEIGLFVPTGGVFQPRRTGAAKFLLYYLLNIYLDPEMVIKLYLLGPIHNAMGLVCRDVVSELVQR